MLSYPQINPIALSLGPLKIHWYGLMYLLGFISAFILGSLRAKKPWQRGITNSDLVSEGLLFGALGVILGGRLGYVLFYNFSYYLSDPKEIFYLWDGGMSFHGGLLGVLIFSWIFAKKNKLKFFDITDFYAPLVPIGLGAGRLGNFINGELFGRVTNSPIGMIFPNGGPYPRYPSQLFEFLGEGVLLFLILFIYSRKLRPRMEVSGLFLVLYGLIRFFIEFFREPDIQKGFYLNIFTMGQLLCIPMIITGVLIIYWARKNRVKSGD